MLKMKVLIAEDESVTARFIQQIVGGMEGMELLQTCNSAQEAYSQILENEPDLLITDIVMRGMSGLELIRHAKKVKPNLQVIIISGYSIFEYTKEAIRLGIEDYILKPIDPEELKKSVKIIRESFRREHNEKRNNKLRQLLRNADFESIKDLYSADQFHILMVSQSGDLEGTMELCSNAMEMCSVENMNIAKWDKAVLMIETLESGLNDSNQLTKLRKWLLQNKDTKTFTMLFTDIPVKKDFLKEILPEFYQRLRAMHILGATTCRSYSDDINKQQVAERGMSFVPPVLLSGKRTGMRDVYSEVFSLWEKERYTVCEVKKAVYALVSKLRMVYPSLEEFPDITEKVMERIEYADNFLEAKEAIWIIIENSTKMSTSNSSDTKIDLKSLYEKISSYLQANYQRNDSLQDIAKKFHVSQPYISRAFREYAGVSYKEFCMQKKIDAAKAMIVTYPNIMFKDVALKVGIDPSYFSTVFHRVTGEYPSEFKAKQGDYINEELY